MSTKELKQALLHQKTGDAEKDVIEVISRALGLEYDMVARVIYAARLPITAGIQPDDDEDLFPVAASIPNPEVKEALTKAIHDGIQRAVIARAILHGRSVTVSPQALLPVERAGELCRGCPTSLECAAQQLSTPENCWHGRYVRNLVVFPLQISGDLVEVEAQQPQGKHIVRLSVINATLHR